MVQRVACLENSFSKSSRFPEDSRKGALTCTSFCTLRHAMLTSILRLPQERTTAKGLFVTVDDRETALTTSIASSVSTRAAKPILTIDEPKAVMTGKAGRLLSKEEQDRVKAAIAKATSMEEVRRLERALKEGYVPDLDSVGA